MPSLKGTETERNLKDAVAGAIQAIRRYRRHAQQVGDPAMGKPIGLTDDNLKAAIATKPLHTPTGIRAPPARRASLRSPAGSRRSPRPGSRKSTGPKGCSARLDGHRSRRAI